MDERGGRRGLQGRKQGHTSMNPISFSLPPFLSQMLGRHLLSLSGGAGGERKE